MTVWSKRVKNGLSRSLRTPSGSGGWWSGPHDPSRYFFPHCPYFEGRVGTRRFLFRDTESRSRIGELTTTDDECCFNWETLEVGELCRRVMVELIQSRDIISGPTRIYGQLVAQSWPTFTPVISLIPPYGHFFESISLPNEPVLCRLWGDYLLDVETRPYLLDYLTDRSDTFAQWMKELPQ